jgi:hypothetical protein
MHARQIFDGRTQRLLLRQDRLPRTRTLRNGRVVCAELGAVIPVDRWDSIRRRRVVEGRRYDESPTVYEGTVDEEGPDERPVHWCATEMRREERTASEMPAEMAA